MSWWKDGSKESNPKPVAAPRAEALGTSPARDRPVPAPAPAASPPPAPVSHREPVEKPAADETLIAVGIVIEGKIQGSTNLRIAGTFIGDLTVQGTLTVDPGGRVVGNVSAKSVVLAGEIQGNIEAASRVAILGSGVLRGDLKAALFVAEAGAQMAGRVEFGGVRG